MYKGLVRKMCTFDDEVKDTFMTQNQYLEKAKNVFGKP
jgi:hypothetical protein